MILTRLRAGNSQFPESKEPGDVVVLANGDIFCHAGGIWVLVGGRFLPKAMREGFLSYISTGWPDPSSAEFDLPTLFDLSVFSKYCDEEDLPSDPKFVKVFSDRVKDVARKLYS